MLDAPTLQLTLKRHDALAHQAHAATWASFARWHRVGTAKNLRQCACAGLSIHRGACTRARIRAHVARMLLFAPRNHRAQCFYRPLHILKRGGVRSRCVGRDQRSARV